MNNLQPLSTLAGPWFGNNQLEDPNTGEREDSAATAIVTPLLREQFVRVDYTWSYQGKAQAGSMLFGFERTAARFTCGWIDSWHMSDVLMLLRGIPGDGPDLSLSGSYAVGGSPDWGWRILVAPTSHQLAIAMFNVSPEGQEDIAVQISLVRASSAPNR